MNFSFAHFPKGTICHVNGVGLGLGKQGLTIEVKGLVQNGVDSWVIQTDLTSPISLTMAFNITYVDAIIRRGDSEDYSSMETDDPYESRDSYYEDLLRRRTDKTSTTMSWELMFYFESLTASTVSTSLIMISCTAISIKALSLGIIASMYSGYMKPLLAKRS